MTEETGVHTKCPPFDPWVGRSKNMICATCMWYSPKCEETGRCRRRCPTMNGYPVVYPRDWCGDHKLRD